MAISTLSNTGGSMTGGSLDPVGPLPEGDLVDIHSALNHVRQLPEFRPITPSPWEKWFNDLYKIPAVSNFQDWLNTAWRQFWEKVASFLKAVVPSLVEKLNMPPIMVHVFTWTIAVLLAVIAMIGVYYLLGFLKRQFAPKIQLPPVEKRFEESLLISSQHHALAAKNFVQSGQLDLAMRELYLATLCVLDETGRVPFVASRTNAEYRQLLRPQPVGVMALSAFQTIAKQFEASRYGHRALQPEDVQLSETAFETLRGVEHQSR